MAEPLTLYKLIILYMLKKVAFPLTNAQISEFVLDQEYTTYFTLQQAISELVANPYYSLLPDEAKAKLLKKIYAYGRDKASEALGFARSDDYKKAYMAEEMGISPGTYYLYNVTANRDGEGIVTQEEAEETLDAMDLTMEQKAYLWALQDAGWSSKSNPYKRRYKIEGFTKR